MRSIREPVRRPAAGAGAGPVNAGAAASSSSPPASRPLFTVGEQGGRRQADPGKTGLWSLPTSAIAVLSGAAAAIHFAVAGEHFAESWLSGAFLTAVALFQGTWGLLITTRPSARLLRAGALVNAAVVLVWATSRTTGLPVGPGGGGPEPVGFVDALASAYEVSIVAGALALGRRRASPSDRDRATGAGAVVLSAAVVALTAAAFWLTAYLGDGRDAHALGHHMPHLLFVGGGAMIFAAHVALDVARHGPLRFSWSLRPHPETSPSPAAFGAGDRRPTGSA